MKTSVTKIVLLAAVAVAPLLSTGAAQAQSYPNAPWSYGAANHSRGYDYRATARDQQSVDEITRNDWDAGK